MGHFIIAFPLKFTAKSVGEKILKINYHLAKLETKLSGSIFLDTVYIYFSNIGP